MRYAISVFLFSVTRPAQRLQCRTITRSRAWERQGRLSSEATRRRKEHSSGKGGPDTSPAPLPNRTKGRNSGQTRLPKTHPPSTNYCTLYTWDEKGGPNKQTWSQRSGD